MENIISIKYRLWLRLHVIKILPIPHRKYIESKKRSVFCLFNRRNKGISGCVRIVGKDQIERHRAMSPAVCHFEPKKNIISLSPPHAIKSKGIIDIMETIFITLSVVLLIILLS